MADFTVRTEDLVEAAQVLGRVAHDVVEPRTAELAVSQGALGSSDVYATLYAANVKQTAAARKAAEDLISLAQLLLDAAEATDTADQNLAKRLNR